MHNSDLSVDFTVRWTDEDNYILKYIENNDVKYIENKHQHRKNHIENNTWWAEIPDLFRVLNMISHE